MAINALRIATFATTSTTSASATTAVAAAIAVVLFAHLANDVHDVRVRNGVLRPVLVKGLDEVNHALLAALVERGAL